LLATPQGIFCICSTPEELKATGNEATKKARLLIQAYPVLVLSTNGWSNCFCPEGGCSRCACGSGWIG